jgi:hypothetical protein
MFSSNFRDTCYAMATAMMEESRQRHRSADEEDAKQALKDARLLTEENLKKVMKYEDCLAGGLCWLRNKKLLNQESLNTILNSVNPSRFAELFCRLAQNNALTRETYLKFSFLSHNNDHLNLVYEILTTLASRYSNVEVRKKYLS